MDLLILHLWLEVPARLWLRWHGEAMKRMGW
jgi:hypothetical protein